MKRLVIAMRQKYFWLYVAIALVVLFPLLKPGYVLTLDMVFTPTIELTSWRSSSFLFYALLHVLDLIFPADFLQKIMLVSIIVFSGVGMHRLVNYLRPKQWQGDWTYACYLAGGLYCLNPFVYSRFMAGQFAVLLGYAVLPFVVKALMQFLHKPVKRSALRLTLLLLLLSIVSVHSMGFAALIGLCLLGPALWNKRADRGWLQAMTRYGGLVLLGWAVCSAYWLIPFVTGHSVQADLVASIADGDRSAFATATDQLGPLGNVLGLQGFWADSKNLYLTAADIYWWWLLPLIGLWVLVIVGMWKGWRVARGQTVGFLVALLLATIIASGSQHTFFAPIHRFFIDVVPFLAGYREPQKFVAVIALIFAYFAGWGFAGLVRAMQKSEVWRQYQPMVIGTVAIIPVLLAPLMFWGFRGQLSAAEYPKDWYAIGKKLDAEKDARVLFLPWHQYMRFDFAGRVVANPADAFFSPKVITSADPELKGLQAKNTQLQTAIETRVLPQIVRADPKLAATLHELGIQYILVAKEVDYKKYKQLSQLPGVIPNEQTEHLLLYRVETIDRKGKQ